MTYTINIKRLGTEKVVESYSESKSQTIYNVISNLLGEAPTPGSFCGFFAVIDDKFIDESDWQTTYIKDNLDLFIAPEEPVSTTTWVLLAVTAASVAYSAYVISNIPKPQDVKTFESSSIYDASTRGNSVKIGQAVPEIFGTNVYYPDLLQPVRKYYQNNEVWAQYAFSLGIGKVDTYDWKAGNTLLSELDPEEYSLTTFYPGEKTTSFPCYRPIPEIGSIGGQGIKITPIYYIYGTPPDYKNSTKEQTKRYTVTKKGTGIQRVEFDINFPTGLANPADDGTPRQLPVKVIAALIKKGTTFTSQGTYTNPKLMVYYDFATQSFKPKPVNGVGVIEEFIIDVPGTYDELGYTFAVYANPAIFTNQDDTLELIIAVAVIGTYGNADQYKRLKCAPKLVGARSVIKPVKNTDGDYDYQDDSLLPVTSSYLSIKVSDTFASDALTKINCQARRIFAEYADGFWETGAPKPGFPIKYILDKLNLLPKLETYLFQQAEAFWKDKYITFNRIFDKTITVSEALRQITQVGFSTITVEAGKLVVRYEDRLSGPADGYFGRENILDEGISEEWNVAPEQYDGTEVEYFDASTESFQTIRLPSPDAELIKPKRIKILGVDNPELACRHAWHDFLTRFYRKVSITFDTELDAAANTPLDIVEISSDLIPTGTNQFTITTVNPGEGKTTIKAKRYNDNIYPLQGPITGETCPEPTHPGTNIIRFLYPASSTEVGCTIPVIWEDTTNSGYSSYKLELLTTGGTSVGEQTIADGAARTTNFIVPANTAQDNYLFRLYADNVQKDEITVYLREGACTGTAGGSTDDFTLTINSADRTNDTTVEIDYTVVAPAETTMKFERNCGSGWVDITPQNTLSNVTISRTSFQAWGSLSSTISGQAPPNSTIKLFSRNLNLKYNEPSYADYGYALIKDRDNLIATTTSDSSGNFTITSYFTADPFLTPSLKLMGSWEPKIIVKLYDDTDAETDFKEFLTDNVKLLDVTNAYWPANLNNIYFEPGHTGHGTNITVPDGYPVFQAGLSDHAASLNHTVTIKIPPASITDNPPPTGSSIFVRVLRKTSYQYPPGYWQTATVYDNIDSQPYSTSQDTYTFQVPTNVDDLLNAEVYGIELEISIVNDASSYISTVIRAPFTVASMYPDAASGSGISFLLTYNSSQEHVYVTDNGTGNVFPRDFNLKAVISGTSTTVKDVTATVPSFGAFKVISILPYRLLEGQPAGNYDLTLTDVTTGTNSTVTIPWPGDPV